MIVFAVVLLGVSGCFSVPLAEVEFLNIQRVTYHKNGKLDIRGTYTQKGMGLTPVNAVVKGDTIELTALPDEKGQKRIASRITVPENVNTVVFCGKKIWERPKAKIPAKKVVPETVPEKKPEPVKTPPAPSAKETVSAPVAPVPAEVDPVEKKPEAITALHINAADFFELKFNELSFEELFWGRSTQTSAVVSSGVKQLGSRKEPVEFNVAKINEFQDLEVLKIKGNTWDSCDLAGLSLPKLKLLVIDDIEVRGLDKVDLPALEEFYLNDRRSAPVSKVALPEKLDKLHTVGIQSFAGNFDYASLKGKPVKELRIHSDLRRFEFLENLPVEKLQISGFTAASGSLDVLRKLPLKTLIIAPYRMSDWNFLVGMQLKKLDILSRTNGNFTPALFKGMPLESLRLRMPPQEYDNDWLMCTALPLKELILYNAVIPEKFLLENKNLESFAAVNCRWNFAEPPIIFGRMSGLRHLAVWQIIYQTDGQEPRIIDRKISWDRCSNRKIRSLAVGVPNPGFIRQMPEVDKVAVRLPAEEVIRVNGLANRRFEVFFCPDASPAIRHRLKQDMLRYNIKVNSPERQDLFPAW